ncbi:MAG: TIGR03086 family metal-binding protein, partial [Acidimicrobiales bacterium]
FIEGLDFFTSAVDRLDAADWERPSPCEGWGTLDVLGHVGAAVQFGTLLLMDRQPAWSPMDPPGGAVEGEPAAWWDALVEPGRRAVAGVDLAKVVDSPMGRRPVGEGLSFPALDLFVHAWDLARSVGEDLEVPAGVIDFAHMVIDPLPEAAVRNSRVFASPAPAPANTSPSQAFIAWTGRNPLWSPDSGR